MGVGCFSCRYKCLERISLLETQQIFNEFWQIGDHNRQWVFIDKSITIIQYKNQSNDEKQRKRSIARQYSLTVQTRKIKVCQTMFLVTFGISNKWLESIQKKKISSTGQIIIADGRGKHLNRLKRIKTEITNQLKSTLNLFRKLNLIIVEHLHNLSSDLNINKMYRKYTEDMKTSEQLKVASKHHYRDVFCNEFNLSFHKPKKDQCDQYTAFNNLSVNEKLIAQKKQDKYL
ncbi:uncharacterized protein LOC118645253 [Monomorium pharaonis]|uniref:uncharacterized protein LOC118645253 n=1 Tax=Monomorium pharaonis TaxID=307658 RepID=UPI0017460020|nr:uncharacterized protein LOC118645253 [Monomorium pharaonis]